MLQVQKLRYFAQLVSIPEESTDLELSLSKRRPVACDLRIRALIDVPMTAGGAKVRRHSQKQACWAEGDSLRFRQRRQGEIRLGPEPDFDFPIL
jgi:hypothetical protein